MPWWEMKWWLNDDKNPPFQYGAFFEKDEKMKAEKMKKVGEETIPNNLVVEDTNYHVISVTGL